MAARKKPLKARKPVSLTKAERRLADAAQIIVGNDVAKMMQGDAYHLPISIAPQKEA